MESKVSVANLDKFRVYASSSLLKCFWYFRGICWQTYKITWCEFFHCILHMIWWCSWKKKRRKTEKTQRETETRGRREYILPERMRSSVISASPRKAAACSGVRFSASWGRRTVSWYLLVILSKYRRDSTSISSCTYSKVLWFKSERGGIWGTCTLLQCFHCTSETISPLINESNDRKLTINYSDNHLNRLM